MKHKITFCVIAAAALASCTQNEDFTSQYNEKAKTMKFDVAYVGKNTRATGDIISIDDKQFILWGAAYKINSTSTGTEGTSTETVETTGIWITDQEPLYFKKGTSYWEGYKEDGCTNKAEVTYPGNNYKTFFTAIAPSDEFANTATTGKVNYNMGGQKSENTTTPTSSTRKLTLENIPVVQEIINGETKSGTDYLIACYSGTQEEVSLTFKHLLSKLRFAVWTDENTMANAGSETTKIELNSLKIYLPKASATATYVQKTHDKVDGDWTWSGFSAPNENEEPSIDGESANYQLFTLYDKGQSTVGKTVSYFGDANTAHTTTNFDQIKLDPTFFIAPTESTTSSPSATTVKLYIDIEYTVKRKVNGSWSTTNDLSQKDVEGQVYSAGHKVVKREKMAIPIKDASHPVDDNNNEGLSHFHQGFIETLYICIRADQKVTFSTFNVADWVEDPIEGDDLF